LNANIVVDYIRGIDTTETRRVNTPAALLLPGGGLGRLILVASGPSADLGSAALSQYLELLRPALFLFRLFGAYLA